MSSGFLSSPAYALIILALATSVIALYLLTARTGSPVLAIISRWFRWGFLALLTGSLIQLFGWSMYPLWILITVSFLVWFLLETLYLWLAVSALSRSEVPLFPHFKENEKKDEWPSQPRFITLKETLRNAGFRRLQSLVTTIGDEVQIRMVVFTDEKETIRISVLFLPHGRNHITECFSITSHLKDGQQLITDNVFLPFGGFYPENWRVERRPWSRNLLKLLQRHHERLDAAGQPLQPFILQPVAQLNEDQRRVERLNRELHFLNPSSEEEEKGRLTPAGKARIWQEIWTLSYLGLPLSYS